MKAPWPWHWSGHWALGSSQCRPPQPGLQWHSPFTQMPLLEHVGSKQSTARGRTKSDMREQKYTQHKLNNHKNGQNRKNIIKIIKTHACTQGW